MSRSYEDIERERTLDKISRDVEAIKDNTSPPSVWDELSNKAVVASTNAIQSGTVKAFDKTRAVGLPYRAKLSERANLVIDIFASLLSLVGAIVFLLILVLGLGGPANIGFVIFIAGCLLRYTSPRKSKWI